MDDKQGKHVFFDRDLSWLSFNERVLMEAENTAVPLLERINFLSIYSSNLDEFYRVRMPAINALDKLHRTEKINLQNAGDPSAIASAARAIIHEQQERFGQTLRQIIPALEASGIFLIYNRPIPSEVLLAIKHYFYSQVLAFLHPVYLAGGNQDFFPENNKLYLLVTGTDKKLKQRLVVLNVPAEQLQRFYKVQSGDKIYILFLEDIIRQHLDALPGLLVQESYTFKVTRDAEFDLEDHYSEDLADLIEKQIAKRDSGLATRFLYEPGIPGKTIAWFTKKLGLPGNTLVAGGRYHNLKDLSGLPVHPPASVDVKNLRYPVRPPLIFPGPDAASLLQEISKRDILVHTPYHSYDAVLQFFNEAAFAEDVEHIYVTMYRVARDSRILHALLAAAGNGKKISVVVELKARFDEANNIRWAKQLKTAGIKVIYTPNQLKVHAKIALVQRRTGKKIHYSGLLATGNLNETTARFYTDHILMTANQELLADLKTSFRFFEQKTRSLQKFNFPNLLVSKNNLLENFLRMIDREIVHVKNGKAGNIIIKLNNLEEQVLIRKLYEASNAGVKISLIIRSICCLVPGVPGFSENITVTRIVDRYLEHGRVYLFHNNGDEELYLGSADWMNRNIYKRIEVCFPVTDPNAKQQLTHILQLLLSDTRQAVQLDSALRNIFKNNTGTGIAAQEASYSYLKMIVDKKGEF